jgi:ribosomal protein L11 methyltransferase
MPVEPDEKKILTFIRGSAQRVSPGEIRKHLQEQYGCVDQRLVASLLRELVARAELQYTYEFGVSFLVPALNRPRHISRRIYIKPASSCFTPPPGKIAIALNPGAAFGCGSHPTTELCLRLLDWVVDRGVSCRYDANPDDMALDIGTGSGILAIAAVQLGLKRAVGIDIESCARKEARENIQLNKVHDQIEIQATPLEQVKGKYGLILANLRIPTLNELHFQILEKCNSKTVLLLSGFRFGEEKGLQEAYAQAGFRCLNQISKHGWTGFICGRS